MLTACRYCERTHCRRDCLQREDRDVSVQRGRVHVATSGDGFHLTATTSACLQVDIFTLILLTDSTAEARTQLVEPKIFSGKRSRRDEPTDRPTSSEAGGDEAVGITTTRRRCAGVFDRRGPTDEEGMEILPAGDKQPQGDVRRSQLRNRITRQPEPSEFGSTAATTAAAAAGTEANLSGRCETGTRRGGSARRGRPGRVRGGKTIRASDEDARQTVSYTQRESATDRQTAVISAVIHRSI